jgi:hypothetical protein
MKIILFTILVCILSIQISQAQWQSDVRLTIDPALSVTSFNNAWCVASNGNVVHVVWEDERDGNEEIYYKRSTDGGISWDADTRLTNNSDWSTSPSVSVSGSIVHVVFYDWRDGNAEIYYKRSTDGGISWEADTRLANDSGYSVYPSVSVSGSVVHVVWADNRDGNLEIYYKHSTDGGSSWETDTRLTSNSAVSEYSSVSVSGSVVHVVWNDNRDGNTEIYYKRSTDGGVSWGEDTRLTNASDVSANPCVAVSDSVVHVVWNDNRDGNAEIYYKRSTNSGENWGADTRLTNNSNMSRYSSISVSGSVVHLVWEDTRDGNLEIYYKRSTNGGSNWGTDTQLTSNSGNSGISSVSVSGSVVHVVWSDNRDGNPEIYYKRDPTGNITGIENIGSEILDEFQLFQNYPNPFNPSTTISYQLPVSGPVTINVYDLLGREVATLLNEEKSAGSYEVNFNASILSSGIYFYKLQAGVFVETKKMILIK